MKNRTLKRFLKKFPWLWAVSNNWLGCDVAVRVHYAGTDDIFKSPYPSHACRQAWAKFKYNTVYGWQHTLKEITPTGGNLAEAIATMKNGFEVTEYVVVRCHDYSLAQTSSDRSYIIYRPRKWQNYNRLIWQFVRPKNEQV